MDSCHKTHHFAPGHFGVNTLLNDFIAFKFTKDAGNIPVTRLQIFLNAFGVLFRSKIDDDPAVTDHFPIKAVSPEIIQILMTTYGSLRLHFQSI